MCGIIGIYGHPKASYLASLGIFSMQHRGQEGAGIAIDTGNSLVIKKGMGEVKNVFGIDKKNIKLFSGTNAIGHIRYSTAGLRRIKEAQPLHIKYKDGEIAIVHNGNLTNAIELRKKLEKQGVKFQTTSDTEIILHLFSRSYKGNLEEGLRESFSQIKGAYSLLFLTPGKLIAARDPFGFRPLSLAQLDKGYVLASETCAFDLLGARYLREIKPGEILSIERKKITSCKIETNCPSCCGAHCIFELIYFSRPDSFTFGCLVSEFQKKIGKKLARQQPVRADIVIPVPDSAIFSALGYSEESNIPFDWGFIRNHYIGRTFIEPTRDQRANEIGLKLCPVSSTLKNKKIIVVDDSIVRGATSKKIVQMLKKAGVKEIHFRVASPAIKYPCYYGIDTPTKKELIASNKTTEEIRKFLGVKSLEYLSIDSLLSCVENPQDFCAACFNGNYPELL